VIVRLALAAALAAVPAAPAAAISIVYDDRAAAEMVFTGPGALSPERGGYRQDPGPGGVFRDRATNDAHSLGKVRAQDLVGLTAPAMAAHLRAAVDASPSGLIGVDEIGNAFRDPRVRPAYRWVNVRGTRIRVAAHNDVRITPGGYRIIRRTQVPPVPGPAHPGARLSAAMAELAATPHPSGGSYAARVHLYIAPAMVTAIGLGRGEHFSLDATGSRSVRPAWRGVVGALAHAGGVWLEMYHGTRASVPAAVWRNAPGRFADYITRHGGAGDARVHLLITGVAAPPAGAPAGCGRPMACQFTLAASTPAGRRALANGVGAYRVGDQAGEWLAQVNRYMP